jgi:peptidyl-prolyl cis-trans isomerase D
MFYTLRRHSNWLWPGLILLVVITFVIFFSPDVSLFNSGSSRSFGTYQGQPIPRDEFVEAYRETELQLIFRYGGMENLNRFNIDKEQEARQRFLMTRKINDLGIQVGAPAVAKAITELPFLQDQQGRFSREMYDNFLNVIGQRYGLTENDFRRFMEHELARRQLVSLFGLSGKLLPPRAVRDAFISQNEQIEANMVLFEATNYLSEVEITSEELSKFYTNRASSYRIPERIQVNYVRFAASNSVAEAEELMAERTNLQQQIEDQYYRQGTNSFTDSEGNPLSEEKAKQQIRDQVRDQFALQAAHRKAGQFATELVDMHDEKPRDGGFLNQLAAAKGFQAQVTEPFSRREDPPGLDVPDDFSSTAFNLTQEQPFAGPLVGEAFVYVISLDRRIPSELPPLDELRERVVEDYRESQSRDLAYEAGQEFYSTLTNQMAAGSAFLEICQQQNVEQIEVPVFSLSTSTLAELQGRVPLSRLKNAISGVEAGEVSQLTPTQKGAFVVHIKSRKPPEEETIEKEFPEFLAQQREQRQYQAFSEWFRRQAELAGLTGPPQAQDEESTSPEARQSGAASDSPGN